MRAPTIETIVPMDLARVLELLKSACSNLKMTASVNVKPGTRFIIAVENDAGVICTATFPTTCDVQPSKLITKSLQRREKVIGGRVDHTQKWQSFLHPHPHLSPLTLSLSLPLSLLPQKEESGLAHNLHLIIFNTLCRQSFPGPLVGGNVGNKEVNKWIDERIANCESPDVDYRKGEVLRLLLSLLKIACQYYGKLRSPFGTDTALGESDAPESAVSRLFTSANSNGAQFSDYGALAHCLQKLPSEGQMQATAAEVQSLLVSGRKKEALHCATEGQLWGPALVLAAQLGDQFYVDTVKQMALRQLVTGSPLRTLCLLIAGRPADVFSTDNMSGGSIPGAVNMSPQPAQYGTNVMLDDWEENLAVITANRTKDDELVLIHLGDCLWKERSEIIAAHICYLVAEANFEPYSDSARLCLIGADHWKFPRTYASPDAIQHIISSLSGI